MSFIGKGGMDGIFFIFNRSGRSFQVARRVFCRKSSYFVGRFFGNWFLMTKLFEAAGFTAAAISAQRQPTRLRFDQQVC